MFQDLINEALETGRPYIKEGEVATYIPELGRADKNKLGISIFCRDGSRFSCGEDVYKRQVYAFKPSKQVCAYWNTHAHSFKVIISSVVRVPSSQEPSLKLDTYL